MSGEMREWYELHGRRVYLYLRTLGADDDTAQELMQDTFVKAMESLRAYRGESSVSTWLCGIARNLGLRECRRRRVRPEELPPDLPDLRPPPDVTAEVREQYRRLRELIDGLEESERTLLFMRTEGGLTFREIGELIGCSETAARVGFYRLRRRLRERLEE